MRPWIIAFAVLGAVSASPPAPAWAAEEVAKGQALAERWCRDCHVIGEAGGGDAGPAFATVAADPERTEAGLRAWLFAPHEPMPDLDLAPSQISAILAYIRSLKPEASQ